MAMSRYLVVYESTPSGFGAFSPDVPGCIACGTTLDETRTLMRSAIVAHVDTLRAEGLPLPESRSVAETAAAEIMDVG